MTRGAHRSVTWGLVLGAAAAAIVACGGASQSKVNAARAVEPHADAASPMPGEHDPRAEIKRLDSEIDAELQTMQLARPTEPPTMDPERMATSPLPTKDPACHPGPSQTCSDSCKLADSICDNAAKICKLTEQLGDDAWAKEKCSSGTASCEAAGKKCCDCI